jgi:hypothetical protein
LVEATKALYAGLARAWSKMTKKARFQQGEKMER